MCLLRAAFQFGVKMKDGRKQKPEGKGGKASATPRRGGGEGGGGGDRDAKLDKQLQQIESVCRYFFPFLFLL
jgi:hypothetical protein